MYNQSLSMEKLEFEISEDRIADSRKRSGQFKSNIPTEWVRSATHSFTDYTTSARE